MNFGIWPPYEAFYIESMLFLSSSAIESIERLSQIFSSEEQVENVTDEDILNFFQNIIIQAAALSRYFWPVNKKDKELNNLHKKRATYLRESFCLGHDSPLKKRYLRNQIEHFDENLDVFCSKIIVGMFYPKYVGPSPTDNGVPIHVFRAYYTDIGVFEVLGEKYEIQPIVDEISNIHDKLIEFSTNGYRIKNTTSTNT